MGPRILAPIPYRPQKIHVDDDDDDENDETQTEAAIEKSREKKPNNITILSFYKEPRTVFLL